jgi:RNA polymerase sigma factor (sigma-70 family)
MRTHAQAVHERIPASMPFDPDTAIGGAHDRFPSTRMSLLEAASASDGLPNDALDQVVALYWKPIYKYIRLKWRKSNEEAKDLTQGFLASALERDFFQRFDPGQASFRTYLRMALDRFAANEHASANRQKRGGGVLIDFEGIETEPRDNAASPEDLFHREWQRQLFTLAVEDLRDHCDRAGKQLQFRIFEAYDLANDDRPDYAGLAECFGITVTTLNNHLAWSRRTLRGFVTERLRGVTSGDRELRRETLSAFGPSR